MKVTSDVGLDVCNVKLNKVVKKLWNLETLSIQENKVLVYRKFYGTKYAYHFNFALSENNQKLLKEYDAIMKAQLADGVVQKVEHRASHRSNIYHTVL